MVDRAGVFHLSFERVIGSVSRNIDDFSAYVTAVGYSVS